MEKTLGQTTTEVKQAQRLAVIDIIRVLLAFIIITYHTWVQLSEHLNLGEDLSPGYIVVEPFFFISGFFLAKAAYKDNATTWYRYTWRRIWHYLPFFVLGISFAFVTFSITSIIYKAPYVLPISNLMGCSWFMWFMFISSAFLFPILKHAKDKFAFPSILIAVGLYIYIFFMNSPDHYITLSYSGANEIASMPIFIPIRGLLRSTAGLMSGAFIFACWRKLQQKNVHIPLFSRIVFCIVGLGAGLVALFFLFVYPRTYWDFAVIGFSFVFLFVVFTNIGLISDKITLPNNVCNVFGQFAFIVYVVHWAVIGFMTVFGDQNMYPWLLDETWWLGIYGMVCYGGSMVLTYATYKLHKVIKEKLLVKCVKLNSI